MPAGQGAPGVNAGSTCGSSLGRCSPYSTVGEHWESPVFAAERRSPVAPGFSLGNRVVASCLTFPLKRFTITTHG